MIITSHGKAFIKAQQGDLIVAFNPINKDADPKAARFGADLALISANLPEYNGADTVSYANKVPFIIDGPGEYEIGGTFVEGLQSKGRNGAINTIYTIVLDGIRICHLGALSDPALDGDTIEKIGSVDILFVPIGGDGVLSPKEASKLAASLEACVVIPTEWDEAEGNIKLFLKEMGAGEGTKTDKLTLKRKDLDGKAGEVVILS